MLAREFTSAEGIFRLTGSIAVINQVKDLYDRVRLKYNYTF